MLMDLFYSCLPPGIGQRYHFHRFMQRVHDELTSRRGNKNPLKDIAAQFASETKVICFDEFYVSDIADAMILGELLKWLFDHEVVLIATSNSEPKTCILMDYRGRNSCPQLTFCLKIQTCLYF